jgi:hypothetical protein
MGGGLNQTNISNISKDSQKMNVFDNSQTISAGVTRSMSMGNFHMMTDFKAQYQPTKVSANLSEFLGGIDDDEEDEDDAVFF